MTICQLKYQIYQLIAHNDLKSGDKVVSLIQNLSIKYVLEILNQILKVKHIILVVKN